MTTPAALVRRIQTVKARKAAEQTGGATVPQADEPAPTGTGFAAVPHRTGQARAGRWLMYGVLALLLVTGAWQLIGRPIYAATHRPPAPPAPVQTIDAGAAGRVAAGFTADYLTYDGQAAGDTTTGSPFAAAGLSGWTGTASLVPAQVIVGQVSPAGADRTVVQTTAKVSPSGGGHPAWLTLDVVVARAGAGLRVTSATLDGDIPAVLRRPGEQIDSQLSVDTQSTAKDLLSALAAGKTSYITTPNVQLTGLSGAVQLADLSAWAVSQAGGETRYATARVTWSLAGTDLKVQQPIALRLKNVDGRWLIDSYGPVMEG